LWVYELQNRVVRVEKKPKDIYGNEKMPPKNPEIIQELADKALYVSLLSV
jgi:hypothetical protein